MIMYNLTKLTLSSILITLIVLGLSSPVAAQQPPPPTIYVDAPSPIPVSTEFDIIIWIRNFPSGWGMIYFGILVQWDPNDLEYIECEFLGDRRPGWDGGCGFKAPGSAGGDGDDDRAFPALRWTEDAEWLRFRFHCLRSGPAPIMVTTPSQTFIIENLGNGETVEVFPEPVTVTVNQVAPVGGVVTSVNKLEVLTPYIALAGLIVAVSTLFIIKRRKD